MVAWVAILLLQGVIPVAVVWLTKPLVDCSRPPSVPESTGKRSSRW